MIRRFDVLGVPVWAANLNSASRQIATWIETRTPAYVCVTGVHGVIESQHDPDLLRIHKAASMVTPDGMPLVWCGRLAGADEIDRVYGPDMMLSVCELSIEFGWRHFFYGAGPGVAQKLAANLETRYPGLQVAGTYCPPFRELTDGEARAVTRMINDSQADIVWVGLSTPKQERWMSVFRQKLEAPVLVGVGAAFDIHAGNLRQAPHWMQRAGLEWMFRLLMEPRRLWRRYLKANPAFLWKIARQRPRLIGE